MGIKKAIFKAYFDNLNPQKVEVIFVLKIFLIDS